MGIPVRNTHRQDKEQEHTVALKSGAPDLRLNMGTKEI